MFIYCLLLCLHCITFNTRYVLRHVQCLCSGAWTAHRSSEQPELSSSSLHYHVFLYSILLLRYFNLCVYYRCELPGFSRRRETRVEAQCDMLLSDMKTLITKVHLRWEWDLRAEHGGYKWEKRAWQDSGEENNRMTGCLCCLTFGWIEIRTECEWVTDRRQWDAETWSWRKHKEKELEGFWWRNSRV